MNALLQHYVLTSHSAVFLGSRVQRRNKGSSATQAVKVTASSANIRTINGRMLFFPSFFLFFSRFRFQFGEAMPTYQKKVKWNVHGVVGCVVSSGSYEHGSERVHIVYHFIRSPMYSPLADSLDCCACPALGLLHSSSHFHLASLITVTQAQMTFSWNPLTSILGDLMRNASCFLGSRSRLYPSSSLHGLM